MASAKKQKKAEKALTLAEAMAQYAVLQSDGKVDFVFVAIVTQCPEHGIESSFGAMARKGSGLTTRDVVGEIALKGLSELGSFEDLANPVDVSAARRAGTPH